LQGTGLVVDALFGSGLSRPLEGAAAETLASAARLELPLVSIDAPSGVMDDTGAATDVSRQLSPSRSFAKN